jgi:hypothetical protein
VLCAQDVPQAASAGPAEAGAAGSEEARVPVRLKWSGTPSTSPTASVKLLGGEWKIDAFVCEAGAVN